MEYTFRTPDDMHVHFRQGEMLKTVVSYTAGVFRRALVMPNTTPAILTGDDVRRYQTEIMKAVHDCFKPLKVASAYERFQPLMTIKLTGDTTPMMIEDAFEAGAIAVKLYPEGVTTNSEDGVSVENIEKLYPVFRAMANCGMVLSVHGEVPGVPILRRESAFLAIFNKLASDLPELKITLEHITTSDAVNAVMSARDGVAATITLHHLILTVDDILAYKHNGAEGLNPHNYCKPVAKNVSDREALLAAAFSGSKKFFLGSDTAPHLRGKKECSCGCAGVWNAPVLVPLLVEVFHRCRKIECLESFMSEFGAEHYGLQPNSGTITYTDIQPVRITDELHGIVPFWAGKEVAWARI